MKTNQEHFKTKIQESGNALIYVLIAIALFAALSMTLGRQTNTNESATLSDDKAALYATELMNYATQAKSVLDQMKFSGTSIDELDFTLPNELGFNAGSHIHKVYHPEGGGLSAPRLPAAVVDEIAANPAAGWYMEAATNVEWTKTGASDVILVAYQISQTLCAQINAKITGSTDIPVMTNTIRNTMINDSLHNGTNTDLLTDPDNAPICSDCHNRASLCVAGAGGEGYAFYNVLADR